MKLLWVVQHAGDAPDGMVSGDYASALKFGRALVRSGHEWHICSAAHAPGVIERVSPDWTVIEGHLKPEPWAYLLSLHPHRRTLFWWLTMKHDPQWGERVIFDAPFTAIVSNSAILTRELERRGRQTMQLHMAAGIEDFVEPAPSASSSDSGEKKWDAVYIGIGRHKDAIQEYAILGPAARGAIRGSCRFGLFGWRWDRTRWARHSQGILPLGEEPRIYAQARCALGMTEFAQVAAGMVNNRNFEVLAAGIPLIAWRYRELVEMFGDRILYSGSFDETRRLLDGVRAGRIHAPDSREWIRQYHTYDQRARQLVDFLQRWQS